MPSLFRTARSSRFKESGFRVSSCWVPIKRNSTRITLACALGVALSWPQLALAQIRGGRGGGSGVRSLINRSLSPRGGNQNSAPARSQRDTRSSAQKNDGSFRERDFADTAGASQPAGTKSAATKPAATTAGKTATQAPATAPAQSVTETLTSPKPVEAAVPVAVETALPAAATAPAAAVVPAAAVRAGANRAGGSADLVLEDISLAQPATLVAGPAYRVKFRNQGVIGAGEFRVALMATVNNAELPAEQQQLLELMQELGDNSPRGGTDVSGLAAGEVGEVTVRLPRSAMKMGRASSSRPAPFSHLVVAVDPDNSISEQDKINNVVKLDRAELDAAMK